MPKLRDPLHSGGAAGKLNEETVLSNYQGRTYAKRHVVPKQPNTKAQKETYARMSWAMKLWQSWLTEEDREAWRGYARRRKRVDRLTGADVRAPGHTVFVGSAIQCKRAGFEAPRKPPSGPEPQPVGLGLAPKGKGVAVPLQRKSVKNIRTTRGTEGGMGEKFSHVWGVLSESRS
jgi:hypothetical protein